MSLNQKVNKISSSTLFHFTKSFDSLVGILESGFKPSFVLEEIKIKNKVLEIYIPMVSFCDIPLSLAKNYMNDRYGCYGIGLPKKWGETYGMNPVLYLRKNSNLATYIDKNFKNLNVLSNNPTMKNNQELVEVIFCSMGIFDHLKPYGGRYKFYDEKEWRYVPEIRKHPLIFKSEYTEKIKKNLEKELKKFVMQFGPEQIRYIIVEKNSDIPKIIKVIKKRYKKEMIQDILSSKVITFKQMREDF